MGRLRIEEPQVNTSNLPSWGCRHNDAIEAYDKARKATRKAAEPDKRNDLLAAEWDALGEIDAVEFQAAQDWLLGLRIAARLHPENVRNLLLDVLGEFIAELVSGDKK